MKPNIVILDAFTSNPGDLSWEELAELGNLTIYDRTSPEEVVTRCKNADIVITNKTVITADTIRQIDRTRMISVLATGYNVVDVKAARQSGIIVSNVPAYSTMSVAQNVFALILDITNSVSRYSEGVHNGRWSSSPDFAYFDTTLIELSGKRMGIVGFGAIGSKVANIAKAFGMEVCAFSSKSRKELGEIQKVDLDTLFRTSDIISLHCPLTEDTYHIVNKSRLALMKSSAILINTGRGPLVDEEALADALKNHHILAAGVDVLSEEPPKPNNPLLGVENCIITPHISWATYQARERLIQITVENVRAFIEGRPQNVVS